MLTLYAAENEAAWLASFFFSVEVRPRYCECDGQGHLSNVVYPAYFELSRLQYFKAANDPEPYASFAFQHVTAELHLRYVAACFYDESLALRSKLATLGRSSAVMEQVLLGAGDSVRALARVAIVRAGPGGVGTAPWSEAQRTALASMDPGLELPRR